jgi:Protein of unknown function (DUF5132)
MAFFEDVFTGNPITGAIVGVGALMLAPTIVPAVGRVLRPAAKAVIKGSIVLYRETLAEVGEAAGDLIAEARAELEKGNSHEKPAVTESGLITRPEAH